MKQLFELGQVVGTPGAVQLMFEENRDPGEFIARHVTGDWGDLTHNDVGIMNDQAVASGLDRIFSVYKLKTGTIWIITEADRSVTTLLLPEEY